MNERGWFTLLVRGLGLYFALAALDSVSMIFGSLLVAWVNTPRNQPFAPLSSAMSFQYNILQGIAHLLPLLAGLYLLFRGGRLIDWLCKSVVGRCPACGHTLSGAEPLCPECGVPSSPRR